MDTVLHPVGVFTTEETHTALLEKIPPNWQVQQIIVGQNWTFSLIKDQVGQLRAGLAASPHHHKLRKDASHHFGQFDASHLNPGHLARYIYSENSIKASVGFATLNALLTLDEALLEEIGAADWLVENSLNKNVAFVARFPFAVEIEPVAKKLWVIEIEPREGEFGQCDLPAILLETEILAITSRHC
jgi:uncharacterized protein (DUF4213/DUF364 family)